MYLGGTKLYHWGLLQPGKIIRMHLERLINYKILMIKSLMIFLAVSDEPINQNKTFLKHTHTNSEFNALCTFFISTSCMNMCLKMERRSKFPLSQ